MDYSLLFVAEQNPFYKSKKNSSYGGSTLSGESDEQRKQCNNFSLINNLFFRGIIIFQEN